MGLSEDQLKEYKEIYEIYGNDKDGNDKGSISYKECTICVRMLGYNPSEEDLKKYKKEIGKEKLDFDNMLAVIKMADQREKVTSEDLIEAFQVFDRDGKGFISIQELRNIYCGLGEKFSDEEFSQMEASIDDGSGSIAYEDFVKMILA